MEMIDDISLIFLAVVLLVTFCIASAYLIGDLVKRYNKRIKTEAKKMISGNGQKVSESVRKRCEWCKYNISCNYYEPFCDINEDWVSNTDECPLKKNKTDSTEETAKEKKEDVESSNED